jgi:hypothetical protein
VYYERFGQIGQKGINATLKTKRTFSYHISLNNQSATRASVIHKTIHNLSTAYPQAVHNLWKTLATQESEKLFSEWQ